MKTLLSTKEVAQLLDVNEKMVYQLISEKELPATKVTGKWLFPKDQVEQWIMSRTVNRQSVPGVLPDYNGLLIIAGSNDILLEKTISLFNKLYPEHVAVFGNLGSLGGLKALRRSLCHMAASHLLQENEDDYNFRFAAEELEEAPAVVNFCRREQALLVAKGNPKNIRSVADFAMSGTRIVNRQPGTGTRLLLDLEIKKAGLKPDDIDGYNKEFHRHLDVGLEILSGRADGGLAISAVAGLLGLDFVPLRTERFDLLIHKNRFFEPGIQLFLGLLHEKEFKDLADSLTGYDLSICGKMVFPQNARIG
ncbi:MAG: helix-turn-helix transcriptional regulator [Desulfomonile tiedjei]|uniref:Helix-turn-helix transcriptional regulator n=1 Tax=Desulfomonile tiedjei TaxID=2358 RepID=A0A9D6UXC1_9BACT|nr:helix-turn-helix transcriptional regulator [Desulfomonile tiedjei]